MHKDDHWHRVCAALGLDPREYDALAVHKDNRVQALERSWISILNWDTESPKAPAQKLRRSSSKVKPIRWDYDFIAELIKEEPDPAGYLVDLTGCSRGAAAQAVRRAKGAKY